MKARQRHTLVAFSFRRAPLIFLAGYFRGGKLEEVFKQVACETLQGRTAFIVAADFKRFPDKVSEAPWLSHLKAPVLHTGEGTCKTADGISEINFLVVSNVLLVDVNVKVQWGVPWGTHAALEIEIDTRFSSEKLLAPSSPPKLPKPKEKPACYDNKLPAEPQREKLWKKVKGELSQTGENKERPKRHQGS